MSINELSLGIGIAILLLLSTALYYGRICIMRILGNQDIIANFLYMQYEEKTEEIMKTEEDQKQKIEYGPIPAFFPVDLDPASSAGPGEEVAQDPASSAGPSEEVAQDPAPQKTKRVMSEAQSEALKQGRRKRKDNLLIKKKDNDNDV